MTRFVLLGVALVATVVVVRLVGRIDWSAVWDALTLLTWWQPLVLLAVVVVRQVLNALPLSLYIRGVSAYRATINDLGAILMSVIAPPPSDLALRVTMFTSWGVSAAKGVAGTLMNTLTFYIVRFSAPAVGFVLLLATGQPRRPALARAGQHRGRGDDRGRDPAGAAQRGAGPDRRRPRRPARPTGPAHGGPRRLGRRRA